MNGKGDKSRVRNIKAYRENFDAIDWGLNIASARRQYNAMWKDVIEKLGIEAKKRLQNEAKKFMR